MGIVGSRVGVVGGSIAGCAAAIALQRSGCDVTVFERSSAGLRDRGAGIAMPVPLRESLIAGDYLDSDYPFWPAKRRDWIVKDGDTPLGRVVWRQPGDASLNNWSILWKSLRARVDDSIYRDGVRVESYEQGPDGVSVLLDDGNQEHFDVLVGADGYRSEVRASIHPGTRPEYAGYILWRGNFPESRLVDREPLDVADETHSWHTICFPGGHGVFYMIPGEEERADIGHRRLNWAIYAAAPGGFTFDKPGSVSPGRIDQQLEGELHWLVAEHFPPWHASVIGLTQSQELSIQPIYDEKAPSYVAGRVLLLGDAGTVTRPHTGSGATKALQEAMLLEQLCSQHDDWNTVLDNYDRERTAAGNSIVELGRRIGAAQVENTPPWASMTPADFEQWVDDTLSGTKLYFYGDKDETSANG
jgi:2-polyprenyl-6-methoxyphenol hydroxylase-like FAD-dependent oxidoreductase